MSSVCFRGHLEEVVMSIPDVVDVVDLKGLSKEELQKLLEQLYQYEGDISDALERVRKQIENIKALM